jgi:hypothetical protein
MWPQGDLKPKIQRDSSRALLSFILGLPGGHEIRVPAAYVVTLRLSLRYATALPLSLRFHPIRISLHCPPFVSNCLPRCIGHASFSTRWH